MRNNVSGFLAFVVIAGLVTIPHSFDTAFAGNGNGNGNGGKGASASNGASQAGTTSPGQEKQAAKSAEPDPQLKNGNQGQQAKLLGALNAAHASAQAFADASANSRVGKIKAYYFANQESLAAAAELATAAQAVTDATTALSLAQTDVDAKLLQLNAALINQAEYDAAVLIRNTAIINLGIATTNYATAQTTAATEEAEAVAALAEAANKPVDDPLIRAALDDLLEGKIPPV